MTAADHAACYVRLGPNAAELMKGTIKVEMPIQGKNKRQDIVKVGSEPGNKRAELEANCVAEMRTLAKTIGLSRGNC